MIDAAFAEGDEARALQQAGWAAALKHPAVPFVSYPYEWCFSMLQDAALLQLELLSDAMDNGWTFIDASAYNVQWRGARPLFIDLPSLRPAAAGEPWLAYRQFCMLYLYPLMLQAHLGLPFNGALRANLEGVSPAEMAALLRGGKRFCAGALSHVALPAAVEARVARKPQTARRPSAQSPRIARGLVYGMQRLTARLKNGIANAGVWQDYAKTHSYGEEDFSKKRAFVERCVGARPRNMLWDLGANTGVFSRLCAPLAKQVVALEADAAAVERLYLQLRDDEGAPNNILPLLVNLANPSPAQGWGGQERQTLPARGKPDFALCLALTHHLRIAANVPLAQQFAWLRALGGEAVAEYVGRDDEMTMQLLAHRRETFDDYNQENFEAQARQHFEVAETLTLKSGKRTLYYLRPLPAQAA